MRGAETTAGPLGQLCPQHRSPGTRLSPMGAGGRGPAGGLGSLLLPEGDAEVGPGSSQGHSTADTFLGAGRGTCVTARVVKLEALGTSGTPV